MDKFKALVEINTGVTKTLEISISSFTELKEFIVKNSNEKISELKIQYKDSEHEWISIASESDFIEMTDEVDFKSLVLLKVELKIKKKSKTSPRKMPPRTKPSPKQVELKNMEEIIIEEKPKKISPSKRSKIPSSGFGGSGSSLTSKKSSWFNQKKSSKPNERYVITEEEFKLFEAKKVTRLKRHTVIFAELSFPGSITDFRQKFCVETFSSFKSEIESVTKCDFSELKTEYFDIDDTPITLESEEDWKEMKNEIIDDVEILMRISVRNRLNVSVNGDTNEVTEIVDVLSERDKKLKKKLFSLVERGKRLEKFIQKHPSTKRFFKHLSKRSESILYISIVRDDPHIDIVKYIITEGLVDVNNPIHTKNGIPLIFHVLSYLGRLGDMKKRIKSGTKMERMLERRAGKFLDILELILRNIEEKNVTLKYVKKKYMNVNALMFALLINLPNEYIFGNGRKIITDYFLDRTMLEHSDVERNTVLHYAIKCENMEVLKNIYQIRSKWESIGGINIRLWKRDIIECSNIYCEMPLHICVKYSNNYELFKFVLERTPIHLMNLQDINRDTVLHICCRYAKYEFAKDLIKNPAIDTLLKNRDNKYPIHEADERNFELGDISKNFISEKEGKYSQKKTEDVKKIKELFTDDQNNPLRFRMINLKDAIHVKTLGRGGESSVSLIKIHGKEYAFIALSQSRSDKETFEKYLSLLFRLRHKNIISFQYYSPSPTGFVVDYCDEEIFSKIEVAERSKQSKFLNPKTTVKILIELADGIKYLHEGIKFVVDGKNITYPIVHCDLKWENVLLKEGEIKIIDFGLASNLKKHYKGNVNESFLKGTGFYISPEVVSLKEKLEKPSRDVWSFSLMMYEILFLTTNPFKGSVPTGIKRKIDKFKYISEKLASDPKFRPPLLHLEKARWLYKLISSCWDADPLKRPSFAEICLSFQNHKDTFVKDVTLIRQNLLEYETKRKSSISLKGKNVMELSSDHERECKFSPNFGEIRNCRVCAKICCTKCIGNYCDYCENDICEKCLEGFLMDKHNYMLKICKKCIVHLINYHKSGKLKIGNMKKKE